LSPPNLIIELKKINEEHGLAPSTPKVVSAFLEQGIREPGSHFTNSRKEEGIVR
jgi:hypothetical protein